MNHQGYPHANGWNRFASRSHPPAFVNMVIPQLELSQRDAISIAGAPLIGDFPSSSGVLGVQEFLVISLMTTLGLRLPSHTPLWRSPGGEDGQGS